MPKASTFDQVCVQILKDRQRNPAIVVKHRLSMDLGKIGEEVELFTRRRLGIPMPQAPSPSTLIPGLSADIIANVDDIKRMASGAGLLMEWDVNGAAPVDKATADARALVCAACPQNSVAKLEAWQTVPVATSLKSRISRLNALKLTSASDAKLGLCATVYAPNHLLVHAPVVVLDKRVKPAAREKLWEKCWITQQGNA
jgi:hypothetical protein